MTKILHSRQLGYSAINTARSALSTVIATNDGITFGSQHLVKRFLRGIFRLKPSLPRYTVTFDVNVVLSYLKHMGQSRDISLQLLSYRLVTLFCLLTGHRDQTIASLDISQMILTSERVVFNISSIQKTTRPGFHIKPIILPAYNDCQEICPVSNIWAYLHRSFAMRGPIVKLLISYAQPFKAVGTTTISRWVKATLELSGIDIHIFSAHSTRSAATSKARMCGISVKDICNAAGWTNAATFGRFYDRPVNDNGVISSVLLNDFSSH